eukprot:c8908_g1_i1.p1 GENE.c8908_g1_i1~~c8908_g1_i1.p1  ORF type:complete len:835 (+),score=210.66 c8908_g1_i1:49-2553(+)
MFWFVSCALGVVLPQSHWSEVGLDDPGQDLEWICREEDVREECDSWLFMNGFMSVSSSTRVFLTLVGMLWALYGAHTSSRIFLESLELLLSRVQKTNNSGKFGLAIRVWSPTQSAVALFGIPRLATLFSIIEAIEAVILDRKGEQTGATVVIGNFVFSTFVITTMAMIASHDVEALPTLKSIAPPTVISWVVCLWVIGFCVGTSETSLYWYNGLALFLMYPIVLFGVYVFAKYFQGNPTRLLQAMLMENETDQPAAIIDENGIEMLLRRKTTRFVSSPAEDHDTEVEHAAQAADADLTQLMYDLTHPSHMSSITIAVRQFSWSALIKPQHQKFEDFKQDMSASLTGKSVVGFKVTQANVRESDLVLKLQVVRRGIAFHDCSVCYSTTAMTSTADVDFESQQKVLRFKAKERVKTIAIPIFPDDEVESEEMFSVFLFDPIGAVIDDDSGRVRVTIIDSAGSAGHVQFAAQRVVTDPAVGQAKLIVTRTRGCNGLITVNYRTVDGTAQGSKDADSIRMSDENLHFLHKSGTLEFAQDELEHSIIIPLFPLPEAAQEMDLYFTVVLSSPDPRANVVGENRLCVVQIEPNAVVKEAAHQILDTLMKRVDILYGVGTWKEQIISHLTLKTKIDMFGSPVEPSYLDIFAHLLTLGWTTSFAFLPPKHLHRGLWTLAFSGIITIFAMLLVIEFSRTMSCAMGMNPHITAITFLSIGLSLTEMIVSLSMAQGLRTISGALQIIVSGTFVNVSLGIGLSWLILSATDRKLQNVGTDIIVVAMVIYLVCSLWWIVSVIGSSPKWHKYKSLSWITHPKGAVFTLLLFSSWIVFVILVSLKATKKW